MDIHLLRTFVAAFEEANFTKAARRLNATQPGVSVQIATLEAHVGTPLFDRNARSVTPTVAGRRLYPRALRLIHDFNSATQEIRALTGAVAGRVAVGVPPMLSPELVPAVLSRFLGSYPHSDVRIVEGHGDALLAQIESRELDLALVTHPPSQPNLAAQRLCRDRIVLASGRRAGLESGGTVSLIAEPFFKIVVPSMLRHALHGVLDEPLRTGRIAPERLIEIDGLACTLAFVAETDWIALLPASAACRDNDGSRVRFSSIAGDEITLDYFSVHARTEPLSVAAQAFIDLAAAELSRITTQGESRVSPRAPHPRGAHRVDLKVAGVDWKAPATAQSVA